ncbi:uncharacterized protein LOC117159296 [Bombus vancouverensis nearcticus]|uniref:uncharacterized protein LOC117159296 n=1 Tax=Bombus vancouverensis nearcticus TaxID=2705178 RepID=UPI00402B9973
MQLRNTALGWIVTGDTGTRKQPSKATFNATLKALHEEVNKFWNVEEVSSNKILSPEEQACEMHYTTHTTRESTRRYNVRLPFKTKSSQLGDTYGLALKRFLSLARSLRKKPTYGAQYQEFLSEYKQLGHMFEIPNYPGDGCYVSHHAVIKADSVPKVRVVFDASARSSSGKSLNDLLIIGPTIQDDLFALIIRFRTYKYVFAADIAKMYRQINIHPEDRRYHKILWRENINDPIKTYQLNTVTYDTASAPYLAIRTLQQLAQDEEQNYPIGARALKRDFYVDDLLTGENTLEKATLLRDELINITMKGGFELRQWVSNEPNLIESIRMTSDASEHLLLDDKDSKKTLGLQWKATQDTLGYSLKQEAKVHKITKRTILSRVSELFNPLAWDDAVPHNIRVAWVKFQEQLRKIHQVTILRRVTIENSIRLQLHGFADASERAYGACIYFHSTDFQDKHWSHLLCSKSRVAPLKTQSLPRLELCAAVLLIQIFSSVTKAVQPSIFWSDSTIVLHGINTPPHSLKPFIANRVTEILQSSNVTQWRHVPSSDNADILSRRGNMEDLVHHNMLYRGSHWLTQAETTWPADEL